MSSENADGSRRRGRPSAGAREAIIAATLDTLRAEGLAKLTTKAVARRAQVSEASVFYHFGDKVGLLHEAMIASLRSVEGLDPAALAGETNHPLAEVLGDIAVALEGFFDQAMPIFSTVQSDAGLRTAFATRLTKGDRGPHRGVQLVGGYLRAMQRDGRVHRSVDTDAIALMLVGAGFLRAWQRYLAGPETKSPLPSSKRTVQTLAALLSPPEAIPRTGSWTSTPPSHR